MPARAKGAALPVRTIRPRPPHVLHRVGDAWRYRHLVPYFGKRMIEKRYQRTVLGAFWIPLRPALDVGARAFLFGGLLGVPSGDVPYFLFLIVGTSAWTLFDRTVFWGTRSLDLNRALLRRIYVPRFVPLLSSLAPSGLDYILYLVIAALGFLYYWLVDGTLYLQLDVGLLSAAAGIALLVALALGIGLFTSVLAAVARDVRFLMRYFLGFWMYITPVLYPLDSLPQKYAFLASLNPATAPIEMVKSGLIGVGEVPFSALAVTIGSIVVVWAFGLWFFNRSEALALDAL